MKGARKLIVYLLVFTLLLSVTSISAFAEQKAWGSVSKYDLVTTAQRTDDLTTFVAILKTAGLEDVMRKQNSYTVFIPSDKAFRKLPEGTVEDLLKAENRERLVAILNHHFVVNRRIICDCMEGVHELETVNGDKLTVWYSPDRVRIGNAMIIRPDITTKNGMIHVIDELLIP